MKILVTGAAGQLGLTITREFRAAHDVVPLAMRDLDITDHAAVEERVAAERPDAIINCAAYNDVDGAENDAVAALRVNAFAVRSLARAAADHGALLVHYSTDFVFDGTRAGRPYAEDDPPQPESVYASSKLLGDWFAMDTPRHYVLRVESLFGASAEENFRGRSSIDRIIDTLGGGGEARAFVDRVVSPSYVVDVAGATRALVEREAPGGLYHCVNSGHCTWYELAVEIGRHVEGTGRPVPVSIRDVALKARRPQYAALSNAKLAAAGVPMPAWQDAIARYVALRRAGAC
jgi:dTDP-4-dehydrorhamnose reductase